MKGTAEPFVLIPRFTSFVGNNEHTGADPERGSFSTAPVDVSEFGRVILTFWRGPLLGASAGATFAAHFQVSEDGLNWTTLSSGTVTAVDTSSKHEFSLSARWFRVMIELEEGTDDEAGITCWATGILERRLP